MPFEVPQANVDGTSGRKKFEDDDVVEEGQ
jgi:hypothetical protein